MKLTCSIDKRSSNCAIEIQSGLLKSSLLLKELRGLATRFAIVTDTIVKGLYGAQLAETLEELGGIWITIDPGEQHKTLSTKEQIEQKLLSEGYGKDSCIIALGGGVITDLAGFVASTYCRGIPLVMIPTTLLAMVDASIGGKNGVNVPQGKNMIGTIYQPAMVCIDQEVLKTQPKHELRTGFAEMIKHGLIADADYFQFLENNARGLLALDCGLMEEAIYRSCIIKNRIVEMDEQESGLRHVLNLGHTVSHALETVTRHGISHGEAVAIGLVVESSIAVELGYLPESILQRIRGVLELYGLNCQVPDSVDPEELLKAMVMDKKSLGGSPRFVMLCDIGQSMHCDGDYCMHVDRQVVIEALSSRIM